MSGNSQFHQLREQVKFLTAELQAIKDNQGNASDVADQKALLRSAKQQQASAKHTLFNSDATADELENASHFLPTLGLQEQARTEARSKRLAEGLKAFPAQQILKRTDLIDSMKASATTGEYYKWRDRMKQVGDTTFANGKRLSNGKTSPSAMAMKSAQQLATNQYKAQQEKLERARNTPLNGAKEKTKRSMPSPLSNWFN